MKVVPWVVVDNLAVGTLVGVGNPVVVGSPAAFVTDKLAVDCPKADKLSGRLNKKKL
jgi:hypothetical protein